MREKKKAIGTVSRQTLSQKCYDVSKYLLKISLKK